MPRHLRMETVAPENELVMTGNSKKRIAKMGAHHDFKNRSMTQKMSKDVDDKTAFQLAAGCKKSFHFLCQNPHIISSK